MEEGVRLAYRTEILILHLLELSVSIASTQLHIAQDNLEHGVVNGLSEVHVKLIHSSLERTGRKTERHKICYNQLQDNSHSFKQNIRFSPCPLEKDVLENDTQRLPKVSV